MDDDTIKRLEDFAHSANQEALSFGVNLDVFMRLARACYAEGQRDAQARIAELEREVTEQARLLGISGSTEARLLARAAELERQLHIEYQRGWKVGHEVAERDQLLCLARIREIVGDSAGVLTQDELVARIDGLRFVAAHSKSQHSAAASPAVRVEGGE